MRVKKRKGILGRSWGRDYIDYRVAIVSVFFKQNWIYSCDLKEHFAEEKGNHEGCEEWEHSKT